MKKGKSMVKRILTATAAAVITMAAVLSAASLMTVRGTLIENAMKPVVIAACVLGSCVGGVVSTYGMGADKLYAALGQGIVCAGIAMLTGFAMSGNSGMDSFVLSIAAALVIPSVIIGLSAKKKRRRR